MHATMVGRCCDADMIASIALPPALQVHQEVQQDKALWQCHYS